MITFGAGVLFSEYLPVGWKLVCAAVLMIGGGIGFYILMFTDKLDFPAMAKQKISWALVLRSMLMAGAMGYMVYEIYHLYGALNNITIGWAGMAFAFIALLPYHVYLYWQQNNPNS